ncbi:hypothetical protein LTS15_009149 [Exophiala xenobiotica]|nr:hypothetical protein LTS15_009149 [Exophiala xenobiotica]
MLAHQYTPPPHQLSSCPALYQPHDVLGTPEDQYILPNPTLLLLLLRSHPLALRPSPAGYVSIFAEAGSTLGEFRFPPLSDWTERNNPANTRYVNPNTGTGAVRPGPSHSAPCRSAPSGPASTGCDASEEDRAPENNIFPQESTTFTSSSKEESAKGEESVITVLSDEETSEEDDVQEYRGTKREASDTQNQGPRKKQAQRSGPSTAGDAPDPTDISDDEVNKPKSSKRELWTPRQSRKVICPAGMKRNEPASWPKDLSRHYCMLFF